MISNLEYKIPKNLQEACALLSEANAKAKVIAGGTDLVIGLRNEALRPDVLVDITRIPELQGIGEEDGLLTIGTGVTHTELASSVLVKRYGKILSDAASEIGSPQIRNLGTLGGNIVNASPAADTVPALMVLDAVGEVVSKEGKRKVAVADLFKGPYQSALRPHEILTRISFEKLQTDTRCGYVRLARREAMAIARMSVGIVLRIGKEEDRIGEIRVSVGAVTPTPRRISAVEEFLRGQRPDRDLFREASRKVSESILGWSGVRASSSYKVPVVEALFIRALEKALTESPLLSGQG